jgi:hypothetical protein
VFRLVADALGHLSPPRVLHRIPRRRRRARDPSGSQAPRPSGPSCLWPARTVSAPSLPHSPSVRRRRRTTCIVSLRRTRPQRTLSTPAARPARLSRIWPTGFGTRLPPLGYALGRKTISSGLHRFYRGARRRIEAPVAGGLRPGRWSRGGRGTPPGVEKGCRRGSGYEEEVELGSSPVLVSLKDLFLPTIER